MTDRRPLRGTLRKLDVSSRSALAAACGAPADGLWMIRLLAP